MKTSLLSTISFVGVALSSSPLLTGPVAPALIARQNTADPDSCEGYVAKNVKSSSNGLTADLTLAAPCRIYGPDIGKLKLEVTYEDGERPF
jgi:alpha-glucosidase